MGYKKLVSYIMALKEDGVLNRAEPEIRKNIEKELEHAKNKFDITFD